MENKYIKFFVVALAVAVIVPQIALAAWWNPFSWGIWNSIFHFQQTTQKQEKLIGGDKDVHGCLPAAGYTWCEVKNKCLRTWEEKCEAVQADFSKLNKDELLHKLFPNLTFKNGVAGMPEKDVYQMLKLSLEKSEIGNFTNKNEKQLLLEVKLDGVPHVGGLYHAYLGVFDSNGNLLTPSSQFGSVAQFSQNEDPLLFNNDKAQFGGDLGQFEFYDCNDGLKYILFISGGCPNSTCCSSGGNVYKVTGGSFEKVQAIDYKFLGITTSEGDYLGLKMTLSGDKINVQKTPFSSDSGCTATDFRKLKWDNNKCIFK